MIFSQKHNRLKFALTSVLVIGLTLFLNLQLIAQSGLQCDPPNWYTNTQYRQLDLLVRGLDFTQTLPIRVEGDAKILSFHPMKNKQYGLLKIEIPEKCKAQNLIFTFIQKDKEFHAKTKSIQLIFPIVERSSFQPAGLDSEDLLYMIYPDRFANGD
ncbi:MAG: hypothetical protein RL062_394, partial [Bacteroidota bacterium]